MFEQIKLSLFYLSICYLLTLCLLVTANLILTRVVGSVTAINLFAVAFLFILPLAPAIYAIVYFGNKYPAWKIALASSSPFAFIGGYLIYRYYDWHRAFVERGQLGTDGETTIANLGYFAGLALVFYHTPITWGLTFLRSRRCDSEL